MPIRYLTAGESHGPALVTIIDEIPAGLDLPVQIIDHELARRQRGYGAGPRMKIEQDRAKLMGGVMAGITTGAPIAILIENRDHAKWANKPIPPMTAPRPGHADLTGAVKYGYSDLRPSLERASARETAARVAAGAVCKHLLSKFDIQIGGYVSSIGEINANLDDIPLSERSRFAEESEVRCPDPDSTKKMIARIEEIIKAKDTLGGVIEAYALGLPPGLGSHVQWERKLEARLGAAILGIQAIKGVEFGHAFEITRLPGTQAHDQIKLEGKKLVRQTNHAGGLEGGITNGQPLIVRAAMKPIATTLTPQSTVDLASGRPTETTYERSDFCPVPRAVPILEAVIAVELADALIEKIGGDSLGEMLPRFKALPGLNLDDFNLSNQDQVWWPE
jgi:chorismate synthase